MYAKVFALAAIAAAALASKVPRTDLYLKTIKCTNLDSESEPYIYAGVDASSLPGTTKYLESSVGKVDGLISTDITFLPNNILAWKNVEDYKYVGKIETYVYGKDAFRPDDNLGSADIEIKKAEPPSDTECDYIKRLDETMDTDLFSRDGTCDFVVAVCPKGVIPEDKDGKWEVGKEQTYTY